MVPWVKRRRSRQSFPWQDGRSSVRNLGKRGRGMRMKEHRGTGVRWLSGAILVLAGCASSPQVMMQSLPNAGETRPSGGSLTGEVSLREAGVLGREDRFFLTQVSVKNRTGAPLAFGPQHVYLADAGGA